MRGLLGRSEKREISAPCWHGELISFLIFQSLESDAGAIFMVIVDLPVCTVAEKLEVRPESLMEM